MKNIKNIYLNFFHFLVVKFSVYLNRRVFVMKFFPFTVDHFSHWTQNTFKISLESVFMPLKGNGYKSKETNLTVKYLPLFSQGVTLKDFRTSPCIGNVSSVLSAKAVCRFEMTAKSCNHAY